MAEIQRLSGLHPDFVRAECRESLDAAVSWGLARCHSDAARALLPPLLALLGEFNATVLPVEHGAEDEDGPEIDFRLTLSRPLPGGAVRVRMAVISGAAAGPVLPDTALPIDRNGASEPGEASIPVITVSGGAALANPWETAARIVGLLIALAGEQADVMMPEKADV